MRLGIVCLFLFFASCLQGSSPYKERITFFLNNDVGYGNSVFVVGNHPDLGAGDVTHALKLRFTSGNFWTGDIAVQSGTTLQYRYIKRSTAQNSWCDPGNTTDLTATFTISVPPQPPAPYSGKTIYYLSGWSAVDLVYNNGGAFVGVAMAKIGPGRTVGESLFKISGIGQAGENIEFVFSDGHGSFDNPPGGGNYLTKIDVFQVQDGNVYSYQPPPSVSAPIILPSHFIDGRANIPGRNVHVYLPRGYNQNISRRYPVVYFQDGQNVFDSSTAFNHVEWQADESATREIGQGRMREAILVGIDNSSARIPEYQPPNDSYQGTQGRADAYADFVINNVRPYVDNTFRTLNDAKNTATTGSSMGGLVSLYFGREYSVFGKIAVMSPALWISPNYVAQVTGEMKKILRVHLDMGTDEGQSDFDNCLSMYDIHLAQGWAANDDLEFVAGCGQQHNEAAWAARLPAVFDYLLPAREDPDELAQRDYPPILIITNLDLGGNTASFSYMSLFGFSHTLSRSSNLTTWDPVLTTEPETLPWSSRSISNSPFPMGQHMFWRLSANPAP